MVLNAKVKMAMESMTEPRLKPPITIGICAKARLVSSAPDVESTPFGDRMVDTSTNPVSAQMMTVSQNTDVELTKALLTVFLLRAAAATMGAYPKPASLEKRPRAIP